MKNKIILFFLTTIISSGVCFSQTEFDVLARYYDSGYNKKYWYQGTVKEKSNCDFYVQYDGGDEKCHTDLYTIVPFMTVQSTGAKVGDTVLARYYDSGLYKKYWYKGTITQKANGKFFVEYDDGDTKWHGNFATLVLFKPLSSY